jgi:beta-glucosidase
MTDSAQSAASERDARARALVSELSLDEKIELMGGDTPFWPGLAEMTASRGYSSRAWVAGELSRVGLPGIRFVDGPRGVMLEGATTFPVSMARGATWDVELEERIGEAIGREARALGANFFGGVCVNLLRHPAWGRAQETYGEDTHHVGALGAALARGVQRHVMACVKHYALNSMENARFKVDVTIDARSLHELYLPHFRRIVEQGIASVMSAYNSVNGAWAGQSHELLTEVLKGSWGFEGFVMSDFVWGVRDARTAVLAGQDVEMPFRNHFDRELKRLVDAGEVSESRIDDAALRVVRQQMRFGGERNAAEYGPEIVGSAEHRALAREAAQKAIVLLKNRDRALPLTGVRRVAVIGHLAATANIGDRGSSNTRPPYVVTPLEGIRAAAASHGAIIDYDDGADTARAAKLAAAADVSVVVVGYTSETEGEYVHPKERARLRSLYPPPRPGEEELAQRILARTLDPDAPGKGGDRASLSLAVRDEELIAAVASANSRTVVAVMTGSAVIAERWREHVAALLILWYPGMEGGHALADILFGAANPSGRLPCSFAAEEQDLPFFDREATAVTYDFWHGYRKLDRDGVTPAFPFGFGLSYTSFALSDLRLNGTHFPPNASVGVSVTVTNTGDVAGEEVVQLYVEVEHSAVPRAPRDLRGFARTSLAPREACVVTLEIPIRDLAYYDEAHGWIIEEAGYTVIAARHSRDPGALQASFRIISSNDARTGRDDPF